MRVALLTGANPKRSRGGPTVRLIAGQWRIEVENVQDTTLHLHLNADEPVQIYPNTVVQSDGCDVQVTFANRGKESHISVYALRVA